MHSLRMVEQILAARGIAVIHETIRQRGLKFGRRFANRIRRQAPRPVMDVSPGLSPVPPSSATPICTSSRVAIHAELKRFDM